MGGEFDHYAERYDEALNQGLSLSGEDKNYFAQRRLSWLSGCLERLGERPQSVLDYGCGTGTATPFLFRELRANSLVGVDPSEASLQLAREQFAKTSSRYLTLEEYEPCGEIDLAYSNGIFHHIPPSYRAKAVHYVFRSLKPGGIFAFWENNAWNPGTRLVMSRVPFDRDAIPVSPLEARGMLSAGGFEILSVDFLFIFPRFLRALRPIEGPLSRLPLGAQYQILCRKPFSTSTAQ